MQNNRINQLNGKCKKYLQILSRVNQIILKLSKIKIYIYEYGT